MTDLQKCYKECARMCRKDHVPIGKVSSINPNTRAKKRWGICRYNPAGSVIEVNALLLEDGNEEALKTTLLHELIHTCAGCQNHGALWSMYADQINCIYDLNISATASQEMMGVDLQIKEEPYRYAAICQSCGRKYFYKRMGKVIQHPSQYHCSCGGQLKAYELVRKEDKNA